MFLDRKRLTKDEKVVKQTKKFDIRAVRDEKEIVKDTNQLEKNTKKAEKAAKQERKAARKERKASKRNKTVLLFDDDVEETGED